MQKETLTQRGLAETYQINRETIKKYMDKLEIKDLKSTTEEKKEELIKMIENLRASRTITQEDINLINSKRDYMNIDTCTDDYFDMYLAMQYSAEEDYNFLLQEVNYLKALIKILESNANMDITKHAYYKKQLREDLKELRQAQAYLVDTYKNRDRLEDDHIKKQEILKQIRKEQEENNTPVL